MRLLDLFEVVLPIPALVLRFLLEVPHRPRVDGWESLLQDLMLPREVGHHTGDYAVILGLLDYGGVALAGEAPGVGVDRLGGLPLQVVEGGTFSGGEYWCIVGLHDI
jgi:hypothetical protein